MNNDIKAEEAQSQSVEIEEEKLAEVTGGARIIDVSRQFETLRLADRFSTVKIADRIGRLNVADLFGSGSRLPLESLQAGNTDWQ